MRRAIYSGRRLMTAPYVGLCLSEDSFKRECRALGLHASEVPKHHVNPGGNATTHYLCNEEGDLVCLVCLGEHKGRTPVQVASLLVHEAVHIWQEYVERIGEVSPSREFEAYSIQAIAQELMDSYVRFQV